MSIDNEKHLYNYLTSEGEVNVVKGRVVLKGHGYQKGALHVDDFVQRVADVAAWVTTNRQKEQLLTALTKVEGKITTGRLASVASKVIKRETPEAKLGKIILQLRSDLGNQIDRDLASLKELLPAPGHLGATPVAQLEQISSSLSKLRSSVAGNEEGSKAVRAVTEDLTRQARDFVKAQAREISACLASNDPCDEVVRSAVERF